MKARQRRTYSFDTRSVMLFAALSLGGAGMMHAQAQTSPVSPFASANKHAEAQTSPASPFASSSNHAQAQTSPFASSNKMAEPSGARAVEKQAAATSAAAAKAAFVQADANKDGQLSIQETTQLPVVNIRFKELDSDKNGLLNRAEFEKGMIR